MNDLMAVLKGYSVTIQPRLKEDGPGFVARYKELGLSVYGLGPTQAEALAELEEVALDVLDDLPVADLPNAIPKNPWADHSGRVTLRMPKVLHAKVEQQAEEQGVSLNQWICHILESGSTAIEGGRAFGAARPEQSPYVVFAPAKRQAMDKATRG